MKETVTIAGWLSRAALRLRMAGIESARLDTLLLLEHVTRRDRAQLLAHDDDRLAEDALQTLDWLVDRRSQHEPIAYILGYVEFYGRRFIVNQHVLVPRPETETMLELLLAAAVTPETTIVDVGTGSGALAVSAKCELPQNEVIATDIDPDCLQVAQTNATQHKAAVAFLPGDLLEPIAALQPSSCLLLCNLPYVPDNHSVNQAARHEPRLALYSGPDGLDHYRRLFTQVKQLQPKPVLIYTESLPMQHISLRTLAAGAGYRLDAAQDYVQQFSIN